MEQNSLKAIKTLKDKGEIIVVAGHTGCGKSHFLNSFAINDKVKEILKLRTGKGKGSLTETEIYVTNHPEIAEDSLYVTGKFKKIYEDDLFFWGNFWNYINTLWLQGFKVGKGKRIELETTLSRYKEYLEIPVFSNNNFKALLQKIEANIDGNIVKGDEYLLNKLEEYFRADEGVFFKYLLNKYTEFKKVKYNDDFIDYLITEEQEETPFKLFKDHLSKQIKALVNEDLETFKKKIEANGGILYPIEGFDFLIELNADTNKEIKDLLLNSEKKSKEYFIDGLSLYFRGKKDLWESGDNLSKCICTKKGNIYLLHFVDTMGLFHMEDTTQNIEKERVKRILKHYNSKILVLIHSSLEDAIVKSAKDMESVLLKELSTEEKASREGIKERELEIFPIFTKVDLGVYNRIAAKDYIEEITDANRFEALRDTVKENYDVLGTISNYNVNRVYMCGLRGDNEIYGLLQNYSSLKDEEGNSIRDIGVMTLSEQSKRLIQDIMGVMTAKVIITEEQEKDLKNLNTLGITPKVNPKSAVVSKYLNNLNTCIQNAYLHYKTVQSSVDNWVWYSKKHKSKSTAYQNIETCFVEYLQDIFEDDVKNIVDNFMQKNEDIFNEIHKEKLESFLKGSISKEVYTNSLVSVNTNTYNRIWFNEMLCNCQKKYGKNFFDTANSQEIEKFLKSTYKKAVEILINKYCIL